jgi:hypothetical protein
MSCNNCDNMICKARASMILLTDELKRAEIEQSVLAETFVRTGDIKLAGQIRKLDDKIWDLKDEIECILNTIDSIRRGTFVSRIPVRRNAGVPKCSH